MKWFLGFVVVLGLAGCEREPGPFEAHFLAHKPLHAYAPSARGCDEGDARYCLTAARDVCMRTDCHRHPLHRSMVERMCTKAVGWRGECWEELNPRLMKNKPDPKGSP